MNETKGTNDPKLNPGKVQRMKERRRQRNASVAAVLCFVAAIAIVGTYTLKDYQKSKQELEQARIQAEELELQNGEMEEVTTNDIKNTGKEEGLPQDTAEKDNDEDESSMQTQELPRSEEAAGQETDGMAKQVSFSAKDKLLWPVEGALLMDYSMDKTVYFSTLDQFKYNPALVISGEKGDQVIASAPGVVKSIDKTAETGTTVDVDLGGGYELLYGQLADVQVKTGDYVESKTVLGYVAEPTIYYSVEGSNVYFEMRKDGQPVNPKDYLVE